MKGLGIGLLIAAMLLTSACANKATQDKAQAVDRGEELYRQIETLMNEGKDEKALEVLSVPGAKADTGTWTESVNLLEARAMTNLGQYTEAEKILRGVRDRQAINKPPLATMAEWQMSFLAEARGDNEQALIHLRGVRLRAADLPEDIRLAELPVRFAVLSYRVGATDEAEANVREAERGLKILMSGDRRREDPGWLPRMSYEMGRSVAPNLQSDDFQMILRSQKVSQKYLLSAIEAGHPTWSARALEEYRRQMSGIWQSMVTLKAPAEFDAASAARWVREGQVRRSAALLDVLDEASLRKIESGSSKEEREAHDLIAALRKKAEEIVHSNAATMLLTEESLRLNSLRRETAPRRHETNPVAPKPLDPAADPN